MMNDFIQAREFRQLEESMRREIDNAVSRISEVHEQGKVVLARLDELMLLRTEDIRSHSEVAGQVKVLEQKAGSQEYKMYGLERETKAIWGRLDAEKSGKLEWIYQLALLVIVALIGVFGGMLYH